MLHQPDEARPERLLGTCACGRWYCVVLVGIGLEALVRAIPAKILAA